MESGFAFLSPAEASLVALIGLRVTSLVWVAPVLSSRAFPASAKTGLSVLLVLLIWPTVEAPAYLEMNASTVLTELFIGLVLGLAAAIFIAAAELAGDMLAVETGLSGANVLDPMSGTHMPVMGQFLGLMTTAFLLSVGGHLAILQTVGSSFQVLPAGSALDIEQGVLSTVGLGSTLLWLGLRFAAPVIGAMMIGNAALGILARTVPQLNLLMVAFPVQITIGLWVLAATLPLMASAFADWPDTYRSMTDELLASLRGGQ